MKQMMDIYKRKVYKFCSNILIILLFLSLIFYNENIYLILFTIFMIEFILFIYLMLPVFLTKKRVIKQQFMYNDNFDNDLVKYNGSKEKPLFRMNNWLIICTLGSFYILHIDSLKYLKRKKHGLTNKIILKNKNNKKYIIYLISK